METLPPTPQLAAAYGVSVAAVCVDLVPFVEAVSTGTDDIQVTVGPESVMLTADKPSGQLPWPTIDGSTPDTSAKWDAYRLDTMEPIDNGVVTLPAECAPEPPIVPSAPEGLTATPGDTIVTLLWSPPTSDGGSPITEYIVEQSPDGSTAWEPAQDSDGDGTDTSATITGLVNGTAYYFRILAVNDNASGPPSLDVKVTPTVAPAYGVTVAAACVDLTPLVNVVSTGTGDTRVSVGPESVDLTADKPSGQLPWPTLDDGTPDTIAKWDAVRLDTMEPFDNGQLTLPAECPPPPIVPSAPEGLVATPGDTTVTLQWSPPTSDGGSPIVDYIVEQSPDGITAWEPVQDSDGDGTDTSATITGLENGTLYYFRILAVNENGTGPPSPDVKVTPNTTPDVPRSLAAAPTNVSGQVRLSWTAPSSDGGSAITDYAIQRSPNGSSGWVTINDGTSTATTHTVTGLTNGTRYYFQVFARNVVGQSPASNTANAIPRTRADRAPSVGGGGDERVGSDPPVVDGAVVRWWLGDHRLRHSTLAERIVWLGDDQ